VTTDELRRLLAEATPRPWHTPGISMRPYTIYGPDDDDIARAWEPADAEIAVAAVNALPGLLDVADAAREVSDPMIADGGGDRWWGAHGTLRDALTRLDGAS
jgi:hypothetical protein